jgi:hypothetical protein
MRKIPTAAKALVISLAVGGVAAGAYSRLMPVTVPGRGGMLQMSRRTYKSIRLAARSGDPLLAIAITDRGLRDGRIRFYKYPKGAAGLLKQSSDRVAQLQLLAKQAMVKRVAGASVDALLRYVEAEPGRTIPLALGAMAGTGYGALKLRRLMLNKRYRQALETGQGLGRA